MSSIIDARPSGRDDDIPPGDLLLDPGNLRLLEHVPETLLETPADQIGTSPIQDRLLEIIGSEKRFKLHNLVMSIHSMGFLRNDRLIVARYDGSKYLVLEGNRRLSAVRTIQKEKAGVSTRIADSIINLPCFVLDGEPISGDEKRLAEYRDAALQYVGIRHLTGIEQWEPASRYEFLARLIDDHGMTPEDIEQKFGHPMSSILRDYRAHILYRKFRDYESERKVRKHKLTYNTFAEATRSPDIRNWLEWTDDSKNFINEQHIRAFFDYVVHFLGLPQPGLFEEEEDWDVEDSAERIVRRYRDMLKRHDPEIESNLDQGNFAKAHELFELRRMGKLEQRLKGYISGLRSVSKSEMRENPDAAITLLGDLSAEALDLKSIIEKLK